MTGDHVTKLVVLVSMTIAVVVEAALMRGGWAPILPLTIAVLVTSFAISVRFSEAAAVFVLLFTYTFPAIVFALRGRFEFGYTTVWVAALLGVILAKGVRNGWALPSPWRVPLALWALTVSLVWPVIALRELDFSLMTLDVPRLSVTGPPGVPPLLAIAWTLNVTLVLGVGILWFDWLFASFDKAERRFRVVILGALAASWLVTTTVAAYQMLVDVTFMNSGLFGFLQRASGLMFDANPFGVIAALGLPAIVATAFVTSWRGRTATVIAVATLAWLGLWASGSRTALATGIIGTSFALYYCCDLVIRTRGITRQLVPAGVVILLTLVLAPVVLQRLSPVGPWRRLEATLPRLTFGELWNRNGYGLHAARMIQDFPGFGVGVGSFHHLVLDYSRVHARGGIPIDNAQNWYRHQLAEFGVFGSLGWITWTVAFGWFVLTAGHSGQARWATGSVRGMLVAIALISTLGMPTQNLAVTLTFWTLAFWYSLLAGGSLRARVQSQTPTSVWLAVWAAVVVCVVGTAYLARHELRVPNRAASFGWPFSYGWYDAEAGPDGQFRWAGRRAVTVVDAPRRWMKLTVSVNHLDIAQKPVDVRVWRDGQDVLTTTLNNSGPVTEYIRVPDGRSRIVLDTWVSRVVRPADFGAADSRELGLMVQWDFVDAPIGARRSVKE